MTNLINSNVNLNKLDTKVSEARKEIAFGLTKVIEHINTELKNDVILGLSNRATKKLIKARILDGVKNTKIERSYNIVFTALFRGIEITVDAMTLPISTIENLVKHATVTNANLYLDGTHDLEECNAHLKTLKTREVKSKTFKKIVK